MTSFRMKNTPTYHQPLDYGTTDIANAEMERALGLQGPQFYRRGMYDDTRARQAQALNTLRGRIMNPTMATAQTGMAREAALRALMGGGGGIRGINAMAQANPALAQQSALAALNEQAGAKRAYSQGLNAMRNQDIRTALTDRAQDDNWRMFQEGMRGAWYDQGRNELLNRKRLDIMRGMLTGKFNRGVNDLERSKQAFDDQQDAADVYTILNGAKSLGEMGIKAYGGTDDDGWDAYASSLGDE